MIFEKRGEITPEEEQKLQEEEQQEQQKEDKSPKTIKKKQEAVLLYVAVLFIVALGLIVLSYFIQQRRNADTINTLTEQHSEFSVQALQNIEDLQNSNLELKDQLEEQDQQIEDLQDELDSTKEELTKLQEDSASQLEEQQNKTIAVEKLLDLYMAVRNKNDTAEAQTALEPYVQYLDGAYAELYDALLEQLS